MKKGNIKGADAWRLTNRDIAEIRLRVQEGEQKAALAREYGVTHQAVYYHCRSGKMARREPYTNAIAAACEARRKGDVALAAAKLNEAASMLLGQQRRVA